MIRYKDECEMLCYLAKRQLNLEKNRIKQDFEEMPINEITAKVFEEIKEFNNEVTFELSRLPSADDIKNGTYLKAAYEELGDIAACLVGYLAWLNNVQKEHLA